MSMSIRVEELNRYFIDLWWECDTGLPDLGPAYPARRQDENEKHLLGFLEQAEHVLSNPPRSREAARDQQTRVGSAFRSLAVEALELEGATLDRLPSRAFSEAAEEFGRQARAFDPDLSGEDIYQAGRNAWTANALQWMVGLPVQVSPSILAYSLLYPYSDNYLDDPAIGASSKQAFNERFRRRLAGEPLGPATSNEKRIFDLVAMIEAEYPRSGHSRVFESLLAIHRAQTKSVQLLRGAAAADEVDVLALSFEKGGTSVLADSYLASSSLSEAQRAYTYGHGIFAQLLDDMEDIEADRQAGRLTVYARPGDESPLDSPANRTFHFGRRVLEDLDCFELEESVRELIRRGADLMLIDAIARRKEYYSEAYLRELEGHSPFRFAFLQGQRNRFFGRFGSLGRLVDSGLVFMNRGSSV